MTWQTLVIYNMKHTYTIQISENWQSIQELSKLYNLLWSQKKKNYWIPLTTIVDLVRECWKVVETESINEKKRGKGKWKRKQQNSISIVSSNSITRIDCRNKKSISRVSDDLNNKKGLLLFKLEMCYKWEFILIKLWWL